MEQITTPRTDEALRRHYSEGDFFGEETTKEAYEFARKLERELIRRNPASATGFDEWWHKNKIEMSVGIMESAFKEISKKAWDAAIISNNNKGQDQ